MLIRRKETKSYGTKKLIEGQFEPGENCIIIEDVVTSGSSILETVTDLKKEGLIVNEAYVIVDREHGGRNHLKNNGIEMKSLFTLTQLIKYLVEDNKIGEEMLEKISKHLANTQAPLKLNDSGKFISNHPNRLSNLFYKFSFGISILQIIQFIKVELDPLY